MFYVPIPPIVITDIAFRRFLISRARSHPIIVNARICALYGYISIFLYLALLPGVVQNIFSVLGAGCASPIGEETRCRSALLSRQGSGQAGRRKIERQGARLRNAVTTRQGGSRPRIPTPPPTASSSQGRSPRFVIFVPLFRWPFAPSSLLFCTPVYLTS